MGHDFDYCGVPGCDICGQPPCPACASNAAELIRLRGIAENEKRLLEVIKRDEVELKRLRALSTRASDVKGMAFIIEDAATVGAVSWQGVARAVSDYLKGE